MTHILPAPLSPASAGAYEAFSTSAVAFRRSGQQHLEFVGGKASDVLNGLVTNDVSRLAVGDGQYAAALTAKGRVVADMRILRLAEERYLTSTTAEAWPGWQSLVRKFVNPRLSKYAPQPWQVIALHGVGALPAASALLQALGAEPLADLAADYSCRVTLVDEQEIVVVQSPALAPGYGGLELLLPATLAAVVDGWIADPATQPASLGTVLVWGEDELWQVARVEAARPQWGRDMDESTIPQEANLERLDAISFEKGCYTGQETVARIHFRGHVNRHLRLLSSDAPLPLQAEVRNADGKVVGDVRSSVLSPKEGPLAIAMVRRELNPGDTVEICWNDEADAAISRTATILR